MARATYDADTRARALELYASEGRLAATAATGVPAGTIASWAKRAGVRCNVEARRLQTEVAVLTLEQRRAELALALLEDADKLRRQLFAKAVITKFDGGQYGSGWCDHTLDQPTMDDQLAVVKALAEAVRTSQLLAGEATDRTELAGLDLEAELRAYQLGERDGRQAADVTEDATA